MEIKDFFEKNKSIAVAFSGGVDSSVLLFLAKQYAERVKAYYVQSAFQPYFEYEDALAVAGLLNIETERLFVDVLSDETVVRNPADRCYYCKKSIFKTITEAAKKDGFETVADGTNATDDVSDRPGFRALGEMGVVSPLRVCGYTKKQIRQIARKNNLPVADKPSYACLATRIPTGTAITKELLEKTEKAENALRGLGFRNFRVRFCEGDARLEFGKDDMILFSKNKEKVSELLLPLYKSISLDLKERTDE